ncbi:MAG: hypothetical protein QG639_24, partial [Patescibacteria group bacterium]|nr:hypothetical protein [Patescibacteria group bacterium]
HWIATFFGIIYKPTQFFWKREQKIPEPFLYKGDQDKIRHVQEIDLTPARRQRIKEFLNSTKAITPSSEDFTDYEQQQLASVMNLFDSGALPAMAINPVNIQKPDLKVRVRTMRGLEEAHEAPQVVIESNEPVAQVRAIPEPQPILPSPEELLATMDHSNAKKDVFLNTNQVAQNIEIPESQAISLSKKKNGEEEEQTTYAHHPQVVDDHVFMKQEDLPQAAAGNTNTVAQATYNSALPFPDKPTEPNKLVGMVLTPSQDIVSNAIVEISTDKGAVARAVKTNLLGQFFITTPLKPGKYVVNVQKDGMTFEPIQIEMKNQIVEPLEIRGK